MGITLPHGQAVLLATVGWLVTIVLLTVGGIRYFKWLRGGSA